MSVWLGIDTGSGKGLGWAMMEEADPLPHRVASGTIYVEQEKGSRDYSPLLTKLWEMMDQCYRHWDDYSGPFKVAYEQVQRHSGVYAAHKYGAQIGIIQTWCARRSVDFVGVSVATVKRVLRCSAAGKAKEQAMVAAAHRLGYTKVKDHNEADAIGVALGAMQWRPTTAKRSAS